MWPSLFGGMFSFAFLCLSSSYSTADPTDEAPQVLFKTEPSLKQLPFEVDYVTDNVTLLQSGHLFLAPNHPRPRPKISYGPQILDLEGNIVWHGLHTVHNISTHVSACRFLGLTEDYICLFDAIDPQSAYSIGKVRILDNTYTPIGPDYGGNGDLRNPDHHEMQTPAVAQGRTLISTVYELREADLTPYNGPKEGLVLDGCFEELNIWSYTVEFRWCSLNHIELWETEVFIHQSTNYSTPIAGDGSIDRPWDFFHINSVDKNEDGDFLISARHLNAVFKVAGKNNPSPAGTILWQLGGNGSDFDMGGVHFARQHMARFMEGNNTITVLSIFDNAYDGFLAHAEYSAGKVIAVNTIEWKAELILEMRLPDSKASRADSQGGLQQLPNGNFLIGWGFLQYITEYDSQGTLLYSAGFSGSHIENFRTYKYDWVGKPKSKPKMVAYTLTCDGKHGLYMYVSWNGATEVDHYRFYTASLSSAGPWSQVAEIKKAKFEDVAFVSASFKPFAYVEAYDKAGNILGSSETVRFFVPRSGFAEQCTRDGCHAPSSFDYGLEFNSWEECLQGMRPPVALTALKILLVGASCIVLWKCRSTLLDRISRLRLPSGSKERHENDAPTIDR